MSYRLLAVALAAVIIPRAVVHSSEHQGLWAPTYYIAAKAELDMPDEILVVGATNLPVGSQLDVGIQDIVGSRQATDSDVVDVAVEKGGFFEVRLHPNRAPQFHHNLLCSIGFDPHSVNQPAAVLRIIGKHGENLGFPNNPETQVASGDNYSLWDQLYVL